MHYTKVIQRPFILILFSGVRVKGILILMFLLLLISCQQHSDDHKTVVGDITPIETNEPGDDGEGPAYPGDDTSNCDSEMQVEVIIGDLNWYEFSDAKTYEEYRNSKTVGKLSIPMTNARCTAFIINSDTIMTNNHCVGNAYTANKVKFLIRDTDQVLQSYDCSRFIMTSRTLDFTLLGCNEKLGHIQGHNILSNEEISVGEEIYVIQENCDYISNPYCLVNKMIAWGELEQVGSYVIGHNADTLGGSSGSPIYSGRSNEVIAIHNAGRTASGSILARNFGIPMTKIIDEIKTKMPQIQIFTEGEQVGNNDCE